LEPVLNFKQQRLDSLMVELGAIQARVRAQEGLLNEAVQRLREYDAECSRKKEEGMTVLEALECQSCQQVLEQRVRREEAELSRLRHLLEQKRSDVVEARKETHTLEKLREIRHGEYETAIQKAEEKSLDDLTAARRFAAAAESVG